MNFFNRSLYNLVLTPQAIYRRMGVQTNKLSLILQVKLMMDDRKPNTFNQRPQKAGQPKKVYSKASLWSIIGSTIVGLGILYSFLISSERLTQLTLYFSLYLLLHAFTLLTEVSNLLLDSADNTIILPAPVNPQTLLVAKLLHVVIIVLRSGLPMMLPGWVAVSFIDSWKATLLFPFICILAILFTVFAVCGFYLLILRFVSAQRFKSILTAVQIGFSIFVFAASQLLPRLIGRNVLQGLSLQDEWWSVYFPAQWFAALYTLVVQANTGRLVVIGAVQAVVFPVIAFYLVVKYLAPAFNRKIGMLAGGETNQRTTPKLKAQQQKAGGLAIALSRKLTRSHTEQAAFRLAWNISSRSREFKMKVYPSFGYLLVYVVIIFMGGPGRKISLQGFREMNHAAFFLMMALVYISSFAINTIITQLQMSEKPKAAWVFFTTPLTEPGQVICGAYKAMIVKFLLPIFIIIAIVMLPLTYGKAAPHLLVGFANVLMSCTLFAWLYLRKFPFSTPIQASTRSGNLILGILVTLLPFGIGVIHTFAWKYPFVLLLLAATSVGITGLLLRQMQKQEWRNILSKYSDE